MGKKLLVATLVLAVLLIAACAPQVTPTATPGFGRGTVSPTSPAGTETPAAFGTPTPTEAVGAETPTLAATTPTAFVAATPTP